MALRWGTAGARALQAAYVGGRGHGVVWKGTWSSPLPSPALTPHIPAWWAHGPAQVSLSHTSSHHCSIHVSNISKPAVWCLYFRRTQGGILGKQYPTALLPTDEGAQVTEESTTELVPTVSSVVQGCLAAGSVGLSVVFPRKRKVQVFSGPRLTGQKDSSFPRPLEMHLIPWILPGSRGRGQDKHT